ncbi:hypothetical protein Vadar_001460 [Vaccinium darrowii]|uniref:Uncharacterized protein n=1 Tax=Vaccinium darrowii TaxID=229202 RepID=A0ACB7X701_9ERIC|nr:hypothetical protein Vadar_001460 [Vaccinium darrowii]
MSFLKKTFRSILGQSNSDDRPTSGGRAPPFCGRLSWLYTTAAIKSPATILESVAVKPTASLSAAGEDISIPTDIVHQSTAGGFRPVDSAGDIRAVSDRYTTLTEVIGFESGDLTVIEVLPSPLMDGVRMRETMRGEDVMMGKFRGNNEILPPMMLSLKENGRPRFNLRKVRKDGRLQISKVRNDRPEVVRKVFPEENRVKVGFICSDLDEDEEEGCSSSKEGEKGERVEGRGDAGDRND